MTRQRTIFWIGLLIYAASFFLVAVMGPGSASQRSPMRGYSCAWGALVAPLLWIDLWSKGAGPVFMPSVLIGGLINPIFVTAMWLVFRGRHSRAVAILRIVLLLMIPVSWIIFVGQFYLPREGYFLWIIGMLLALFSNGLATIQGWRRGSVD